MDGQDWTPLKISNANAKVKTGRTVTPAHVASEVSHARKIADSEVPMKLKMLTPESRQVLIQMRVGMKKNQTELNQLCNFPPNTIREMEAGRLTPTIQQLNTLNRVLKTGLKLG